MELWIPNKYKHISKKIMCSFASIAAIVVVVAI